MNVNILVIKLGLLLIVRFYVSQKKFTITLLIVKILCFGEKF